MTLKTYRKKRDFRKTTEPLGDEPGSPPGAERSFVVQKHKARRLHYDFRLELDGVLKSWAVPKGPSTNPEDKRLAVMVEDHPLEYADFEGVIPAGEYGAGSVLVWDRGTWVPEGCEDPVKGLEKGVLKFSLRGRKLQGSWVLARMEGRAGGGAGNEWLLIKHRDPPVSGNAQPSVVERLPRSVQSDRTIEEVTTRPEAVFFQGIHLSKRKGVQSSSPFPEEVKPELPTLAKAAPQGREWLHELKYDGYRILASKQGDAVRLTSRNGKDWTARFQAVAQAVRTLAGDLILDGEIVALDAQGRSSFQSLQQRLKGRRSGELVYFVFDLLWFQGYDLRGLELEERKHVLRHLLKRAFPEPDALVRFSDHQEGKGELFFQRACAAGVEGIVSKKSRSRYAGRRTRDWLKVKCGRRQEFVIGGFTAPGGARVGFGSLLLGYYDPGGKLRYAGRAGTGFDDAMLRSLHQKLAKLEVKASPFADPPPRREVRQPAWVEPRLVAEVAFAEWTQDGRLRHPVFEGLREDKAAREVVREEEPASESGAAGGAPSAATPGATSSGTRGGDSVEIAGIVITHPDRFVFPDSGVTKEEVARYYFDIAPHLLRHIAGRPLAVVRCPEGRHKACFFQKHLTAGMPKAVGSVRVITRDGPESYLTVHSAEGLVALAQFGILEIHPWLSRNDRLDRPDRMIFDLDPGEGVSWEEVLGAGFLLRHLLREWGLESFPKLTGGKGVHVVVPLKRAWDFPVIKSAAKAVAERVRGMNPERFLTSATKAKRGGRIYLDYLRNGQGATAVAPFSLRARSGAPVAVPVDWDEVQPGLKPDAYAIGTVLARWSGRKRDSWEGFFDLKQSLAKSVLRDLGVG